MGSVDRKTLSWLGVGALVGLLIGLAIGWWLWPVEWVNAHPADLAPGYQEDYVAMVADSYALTSDLATAKQRLEGWSEAKLGEVMGNLLISHQSDGRTLEARRIQDLSAALNVPLAPAAGPTPPPTTNGGSTLTKVLSICGILLAAVLVAGGIFLLISYLRRKRRYLSRVAFSCSSPTCAVKTC